VWSLSIGPANRCAVSGEFQLVQVVDLESADLVLSLPHTGENPSYSVALTESAVLYTQENTCVRYGRDGSTYGWGDLPSYAALAKLVRMPMAKNIHAGWASLRSLARLQPWLINCREQGSGATFLQLAVTHGVDGAMLEALLAEVPIIGLLRAHHPEKVGGGAASAWHAALDQKSDIWVSRLVQAVVSGRVYATPAAMSPIAETFGALARKFPRQYLRLLSEMPLAFEDSCRLRSPHTRRLQVEVCGSRRFLLDGWWEDHYAASGLDFGFSPRALLAWAHSWIADPDKLRRRTIYADGGLRAGNSGRGEQWWSVEALVCSLMVRLRDCWVACCCAVCRRCCEEEEAADSPGGQRGGGGRGGGMRTTGRASAGQYRPAEGGAASSPHHKVGNLFRSIARFQGAVDQQRSGYAVLTESIPPPSSRRRRKRGADGTTHDHKGDRTPPLLSRDASAVSDPASASSNSSAAEMAAVARVQQVPFCEFAGFATNHLALIVDASIATGDRTVFKSPSVEALLHFKWRAFGSVIWWLHTALWLSYTLATAVFAYAATYYFTDSQSAWKSMPFSFRAPYDYFMNEDAPLMDELKDCAKKFGFPLLPKPPGGQRTARDHCVFYLILALVSSLTSLALGVVFFFINTMYIVVSVREGKTHLSYQYATKAAVIRFFYVVMQLLGLAVVHFGASVDQGLLGPELTRMLLALGMGLQWVELIRILTRHPEFGELYQMVIETFSQTRYFIYFMLMVTCMGSLTLGLLLFDVHTVIDYPPDMDYSSEMLLLDEKYEQTATGTIDLWYNFGDIFRSFHSTIDIFFFGTKSDAVESALLEVLPARYIAMSLQIFSQVVLLNLLIAKINDAYAKIKASSLLSSNFQQALILIEYEIIAQALFSTRGGRWPRWLHICMPPAEPPERDRITDLHEELQTVREANARLEAALEAIAAGQATQEASMRRLEALVRATAES